MRLGRALSGFLGHRVATASTQWSCSVKARLSRDQAHRAVASLNQITRRVVTPRSAVCSLLASTTPRDLSGRCDPVKLSMFLFCCLLQHCSYVSSPRLSPGITSLIVRILSPVLLVLGISLFWTRNCRDGSFSFISSSYHWTTRYVPVLISSLLDWKYNLAFPAKLRTTSYQSG